MTTQIIYVLNANGEPLMPTHRLGKVRHWLNCGEAHWFGNSRTTIQFDRPVGNTTQNCIEGVDLGNHIGISVVCTTIVAPDAIVYDIARLVLTTVKSRMVG